MYTDNTKEILFKLNKKRAVALNVSAETVRKANNSAFDKLYKCEKLRDFWFAA